MPEPCRVHPVAPAQQRSRLAATVFAAVALSMLAVLVGRTASPAPPASLLGETQNPATAPSDSESSDLPATAYLGGALDAAQLPPQCPPGRGARCEGLASKCAQCIDGSGSCFPRSKGFGDIRLTKTDGAGSFQDYYFLNIEGPLGHELVVVLRSTDGYRREWNQRGSLWTGRIHQPCANGRESDAVDLVQVTDGMTGEMALFRFPCEGATRCGAAANPERTAGHASHVPPTPPPSAAGAPAEEAGHMKLHMIPTARYPDALCNDGTPAGFYIRPSSVPPAVDARASARWLVFLHGGFWCWDEQSCKHRTTMYPGLLSSATWTPTRTYDGIFSRHAHLSPFASANAVSVPYCSSDAWVGDVGGGTLDSSGRNASVLGWHFRGQAIVRAVVGELRRVYGLGRSEAAAEEVFLAGCSAGARGAMSLLDSIPDLVPGSRVYGIFDSGLSLGLEPLVDTLTPLVEQIKTVVKRHNAVGALGTACRAVYSSEQWKCLVGEFRAPLLQRAHLISQSQYDSFQLSWDLGGAQPPLTGDAARYAGTFRDWMRTALAAAAQGGAAVYSSACYQHCLSLAPSFWEDTFVTSGGEVVSFSAAISRWMRRLDSRGGGKEGAEQVDMADCRGFDCSCS